MKFNCCDNRYIAMIKSAFEKAEHAVQGIKLQNETTVHYPDGQGIVELDISAGGQIGDLQKQVTDNTNAISALDSELANETARITSITRALTTETRVRYNSDIALETKIDAKQGTLTAGTNVQISDSNVISATDTKYTAGSGIAINDNNVISCTVTGSDFDAQNNDGNIRFLKDGVQQAILKEGANVTISADGTISASGGSARAATTSEVRMADGRTVQVAIDSIEDEIGDNGTSGTIQYRLDALESADTAINARVTSNTEEIATKQDVLNTAQINAANSGITSAKVTQYDGYDSKISALETADVSLSKAYSAFSVDKSTSGKIGLTMSAVDGMTSASADLITAGSNITISNGVISASGGSAGLTWSDTYVANAKLYIYRFSASRQLNSQLGHMQTSAIVPLTYGMSTVTLPLGAEDEQALGIIRFEIRWTSSGVALRLCNLSYYDDQWGTTSNPSTEIEFIGCFV